MIERWLPIPGYEGLYDASDLGRIRSVERRVRSHHGSMRRVRERILKQCPDHGGYPSVGLNRAGRRLTKKVANLVALTFIGPKPFPAADVCHNDGDKMNSRLSNLRYDTKSANERDKIAHGGHRQVNKTHCPQGHLYDEENTYIYPTTGHRACRTCTQEYFAKQKKPAAPRQPVQHGTLSKYKYGCRCDDCRAAQSAYYKDWWQRRKAG